MSLGQAAGVAAHLALQAGLPVRDVPICTLQRMLVDQGQVLTYFEDLSKDSPQFKAFQCLGTLGLFTDYRARAEEPLVAGDAQHWLHCVYPGSPGIVPKDLTRPVRVGEWARMCAEAMGKNATSPAPDGDRVVLRGEAAAGLFADYQSLGEADHRG